MQHTVAKCWHWFQPLWKCVKWAAAQRIDAAGLTQRFSGYLQPLPCSMLSSCCQLLSGIQAMHNEQAKHTMQSTAGIQRSGQCLVTQCSRLVCTAPQPGAHPAYDRLRRH